MKPLSPTAQKVQDLLNSLGGSYQVIEFAESTHTAQEAADRVGCKLAQIVKSLIFKAVPSNAGILVLASGINRVDEKKVGAYLGETIARADPDFVRSVTGFAIGGVPPVGHSQPMRAFVDEELMKHPTVWAAAGTPNTVFELSPADLVRLTGGTIADVRSN
ncbi:MAG TPA: YbaK/EbsC family protein [Anaerolineales bacterium]|nr:YbaK/EbsC family protein [Anaerolineales bacterium]